MRIFLTLFILFFSKISLAEFIKPHPDFLPEEVVSIQLTALQKNNIPFKNAGIEQTWKFAHPNNRKFTGPLSKFKSMMNTPSYSIMLNHIETKNFTTSIWASWAHLSSFPLKTVFIN